MTTDEDKNYNETFEVHKSFDELIDRYDGFILDQFGVLHNGSVGLPGAPDLVRKLHDADKKMVILSNSSSSSKSCKAKLPALGYNPEFFVNAVTSGEEAGCYIRDEYGETKKKALWFTWRQTASPSPMRFLELCGDITTTTDPKEADFIILHGVDVLRGPGEDGIAKEVSLGNFHVEGKLNENSDGNSVTIDSVLKICADRKLPMICANPDSIMVKPDQSIAHMPGAIVERYEELGGDCVSFGKPHVPHFEACLRDLGLPRDKVVHVGDSLHHDVNGANETGIDSVFVVGGVHRKELGTKLNEVPSKAALTKLFKKHSQMPTYVVPMFRTL